VTSPDSQDIGPLAIDRIDTPIGPALLATDRDGYLRAFDWEDCDDRQVRLLRRFAPHAPLVEGAAPVALRRAIGAYFDGDLAVLHTIPWRSRGTPFQLACWQALCEIPAGTTSTYGTQAVAIGRPAAVRAVGMANGCNPVGVIVPCHRVIGADGSLTGYGGKLWRKRWLLRHEGAPFRDEGEQLSYLQDPVSCRR
jgi:methylated-DNA-[protein]-cysteine S-methyltransferase